VPVVKDERPQLIHVKFALCKFLEEEGYFPARFHPQAITFHPHPFDRVLSELVHEAQIMEPKVHV
jgi:hypothetical protein